MKSIVEENEFMVDVFIIPLNTNKQYSVSFDNESYKTKDGEVLIAGRHDNVIGVNVYNDDFVKEIVKGKDYYVGEAYLSHSNNKPMLPLSAAVYDNSGKLIGAVATGIYLTYFSTTYIEGYNFNQGYIFIVDERGRMISHPDESLVLNDDIAQELDDLIKNIISGKSSFIGNFKGEKKYYFTASVPIDKNYVRDKWFVTMTVPYKVVFTTAYKALEIIMISCLVLLFIIIFGLNFIFKHFVKKPLKRLTNSLSCRAVAAAAGWRRVPRRGRRGTPGPEYPV